MSLFGAKKSVTSLKESLARAKENLQQRETVSPSVASEESSHIGGLLDEITGPVTVTDDGMGTERDDLEQMERDLHGDSEYERLRDEEKKEEFEAGLRYARNEDVLRRAENSQTTSRVDTGQLPSDLNDMRAYSDLTGKTGVMGITRYGSDGSSLSPPPTTNYGGSEISFPSQTPRERVMSPLPTTNYSEGSLMGLPLSALNALTEDPFSTAKASAGIISRRYIQSEENTSKDAEKEGGMEETRKVYTPIPRKFEISDSSDNEDDTMTEVEWRDEEVYMTPTKKGKKRNKGKGVKRPVTPDQPIPNMPQTPSRKRLEADWAKPAELLTNENEPVNLEAFIGEYLRNTNGLRDYMATNQLHDERYDEWCLKQAEFMAARQNHTDAGVTANRRTSEKILTEVELSRRYDEERGEKLDQRLEKMERKVAKLAPVNMAKTIENAMLACMEKMVDQLTDRVVKRFEDAAEESRKKDEIRRGKQVEATPEERDMSDIEFEPGATFSEEENEKVDRVCEQMLVDEQELEASKHAPIIPPGEKRQEFPRFTPSGQVTIAKRPVVAPAVP